MFVSDNLNVNSSGELTIGGISTVALAAEFGTPLYVMDEDVIRENCRKYKNSIDKFYSNNSIALYASKAFCCKSICKIVDSEGMGLDVVSGGELYTAISANFPAEKIVFHGNNKTTAELSLALEYGVHRIVVDNLTELHTLNGLAQKLGKNADIMLRIKPGVDAHTHNFIRTGQIDSKFGFALETSEAFNAIKEAISLKNISMKCLHCHIGSQIFELDPFELAAKIMLSLMAKVKQELGYEIPELNLGGGFGIKYLSEDRAIEYEKYMETISKVVHSECERLNLSAPRIFLEPGRSIVGPAGITLYTVGAVKVIPNIRTYVSIDGGMSDNPRYALYKAKYSACIANKASLPFSETVTIAGKCCESGDLIGEGVPLQKAEPGDILAVFSTGAYNYSMASNYNRIPRPPVVMVKNGTARVVIKRESYEDLIKNDLL